MGRVAIIGSGLVGRGWAISYARAGHEVSLWDADPAAPAAATDYVAGILGDLASLDLLNAQTPEAIFARIRTARTIEEALAGAIHVQENTPERLEVKCEVFAQLDAAAPAEATLASSTSALLPSAFTAGLAGRHRCLVVHPINPPYLVPAAEIVPAPWTAPEVIERTRVFLTEAGHAPLVLARELDGFIMNRLQGALLEEAFRLVDEGYASAEEIDIGIRDGLAPRWSFIGPFETIDLNAPGGVRDYVARYQRMYAAIFAQTRRRADWEGAVLDRIEAERRQSLPASGLGDRQVWRDRRLMALAAHKRRSDREFGK